MATKQNESTMKFKADIAELKSGMQQAKTAIAQAKAEFDKSSEGLDNWRKSSEGVEAKLKQLRSTLQAQNSVLDNYREQLAKTEEQFGENSVQAEQLREKIEKQKSTISKTKKEINNFEGSLKELAEAESLAEKEGISVDDALKKMKNSAEDVEEAVEDTSDGFTTFKGTLASLVADGIKNFISGVANAIAETEEFRGELAMLEATANTTGTGFDKASEKLKEIATITKDTGAGVEAVNNLMSAGFKGENLDKLTEQLLGASIKWKDTLKMEGLADGLQETLATGSAVGPFSELLERSGQNLDTFNEGLAKCTTEAQKQNYVLQELSKLGLTDVLDEYKEQNKYMLMNSEASYSMQESMVAMAEKVEPVIATVKSGVADLFSTLLGMGGNISFEPLAEKISSGFGLIKKVMTGEMSVGELMTMGSEWIKSLGDGLVDKIPDLISKGLDMVVKFTGTLRENMPKLIQSGLEFIQNLVKGLMNALPDLIAKFPIIVSNIANVINDNAPTILKAGFNIIVSIVKGIINAIPTLVANIPKIITAIVDVWSAFNWLNLGKTAITKLGSGITSAKALAQKGAKAVFDAVWNGVKSLPDKMKTIGSDLVKGLWNGIKNMSGWIIDKVQGFGGDVLGGIKDFFGIHSPSKVMEDQVGKNLVLGIGKGIDENSDYAKAIVEKFGEDLFGTLEKRLSNYKVYHDMSLEEEMNYWNQARKLFKKGSQDRINADAKYFEAKKKLEEENTKNAEKAREELKKIEEQKVKDVEEAQKEFERIEQEKLDNAEDNLAKEKRIRNVSLAEEVSYWKKVVSTTAEGSEARIKAENKYYDALEAYQKQYDDYVKKVMNQTKLFDVFNKGDEVSGSTLIDNLETQIQSLKDYETVMTQLREKIGSTNLFTEISELGTESLAELEAINAMSEEDLQKYVDLYDQKLAKAQEQANEKYGVIGTTVSTTNDAILLDTEDALSTIVTQVKTYLGQVETTVSTTMSNVRTQLASMKTALSEMEALRSQMSALESSGDVETTGESSGASSVTYVFNQTNNSPKALSRTDIYRQTKNLVSGAVGV